MSRSSLLIKRWTAICWNGWPPTLLLAEPAEGDRTEENKKDSTTVVVEVKVMDVGANRTSKYRW